LAASKAFEMLILGRSENPVASAKVLQKAAKIQRIQIVNKPGIRATNDSEVKDSVHDIDLISRGL